MTNAVPWLTTAFGELVAGVAEVPGADNNLRILEYLRSTSIGDGGGDETPWCSAFVNWAMLINGIPRTRSASARSWIEWGQTSKPVVGAVTVLWRRDANSPLGHVGFYLGGNSGSVILLGGNQGNAVSVQSFPKARVLAYRMPK